MRRAVLHAVLGAVLLLVLFGASGRASADVKSLTITPSAMQPVINPGATSRGSFQILNQGQVNYSVHVYAAPYSVRTEAYTPDFSPLPGHTDVAEWLTFSTSQAVVAANKAVTVNYSLAVPAQTQPGGYYAVVFAETSAPKKGSGVVVNERVGEIFYIQVAGPVKQAGKILSWASPFLQKPPLVATLRLENEGGVHYQSNIQIVVRDMFSNPKYTLTTQKEILPQTIRKVTDSWTNAPSLGLFKVTGSATVLGKKQVLPTKYVLVMSQSVRVACLVLIILLVVLGLARYLIRRRLSKNRPTRYSK